MFFQSRHFFAYGNTAQGFIDKLPSNLQGIDRLFIFQGEPGMGKAGVMNSFAAECGKTGCILEYLHCPSAPDTYDGIIIPELRLAVVDATDLHYTALASLNADMYCIDMAPVFDSNRYDALKTRDLASEIENCHENAFQCFGSALRVHDEWEKLYIAAMDFAKADLLTAETESLILGESRYDKAPVSKIRFFGASTPLGPMDYIDSLTGDISKRYLLKGRPGTGKSTVLRKLAAASSARGLDTEVYHCAFDSNSLDMLIWPELDVCLFDSTAPHLYAPTRPSDEVIDMYTSCVRPGTDEKYEKELEGITARYKENVQNGTDCLRQAKEHMDELSGCYSNAAEDSKIRKLCEVFAGQLRR